MDVAIVIAWWIALLGALVLTAIAVLEIVRVVHHAREIDRLAKVALPAAVGIGQAPALFEGGDPASAVLIPVLLMLKASVIVNAILLVINLIPIPPVDGGRIAVGLLPPGPAETLARIEPYGIFVLIGIIYLDRSIGILGTAVHVVVWAILG